VIEEDFSEFLPAQYLVVEQGRTTSDGGFQNEGSVFFSREVSCRNGAENPFSSEKTGVIVCSVGRSQNPDLSTSGRPVRSNSQAVVVLDSKQRCFDAESSVRRGG
jgi:hypothetical protein